MKDRNNPVGWFEIPTTSILRATQFYEKVLDCKLTFEEMGSLKMAMFPMQEKGEGSAGALVEGPNHTPSHDGSLLYFSTDDIDGTLSKVTANGGKVLRGKTSIGEYGWIGDFEDSEGNRVALHSEKK
jgi:uncharacterized protein